MNTPPPTQPDSPTTPTPHRWRLNVDPTRCIGSGVCAGSAPTLFDLHAGRATARPEPLDPDDHLIDVAASCPAEAITLHDTHGHPVPLDR